MGLSLVERLRAPNVTLGEMDKSGREAADEIEHCWAQEIELTQKIIRLREEIERLHTFEAERDAEIERLKNAVDTAALHRAKLDGYRNAAADLLPIIRNLLLGATLNATEAIEARSQKDHTHGPQDSH